MHKIPLVDFIILNTDDFLELKLIPKKKLTSEREWYRDIRLKIRDKIFYQEFPFDIRICSCC